MGRGTAASGQEIIVQVHPAPAVQVVGLPMATENPARSGNFGFVEGTFGADFLGFVGMPAVQDHAILLDYDRRVLTVARVASDGRMALPAPPAAEVLAEFAILLLPDELPMAVGAVGDQPVLLSLDTGDSGTAYLTPALQARVQATAALTTLADGRVWLTGVAIGGVDVGAVDMAPIIAGSPQGRRGSPCLMPRDGSGVGQAGRRAASSHSATKPTDRMTFQPAMEIPPKAQAISSQRTTAPTSSVGSSNSCADSPSIEPAVQEASPSHHFCSTPT